MTICKHCHAEVPERPSGIDICPQCGPGEGETLDAYECPNCDKLLPEEQFDDEHSECRSCQQEVA